MRRLLERMDGFFFRPVTASGFGVLRIGFAAVVLYAFAVQWPDVAEYYAEEGFLPHDLQHLALRGAWRFTLLDTVTSADGVFALYLLLLACAALTLVGIAPRLSTILTTLLLFTFHERNPFILSGGDTMLRLVGFLLMISPGTSALSLSRLRRRFTAWKKDKADLPPPTMPIWPYRMLLWQLIVLYGTATWYKLLGDMWLGGTAVAAALHHPYFTRVSPEFVNAFTPVLPYVGYGALLFQTAWLGLLIPSRFSRMLLKRLLILGGILFHGSILVLMDAGDFSPIMLVAYAGLLLDDDLERIRTLLNRKRAGPVAVLYDGRCGLCRRSIFWLRAGDWLRRLAFHDFRDAAVRKRVAPDIAFEDLDKSMHIRHASGKTLNGFDAFRSLCAHLPPYWPLVPLLWLPGVAPVGRRVYARIAARRERCDHEACAI